jgi:hypothetical protein
MFLSIIITFSLSVKAQFEIKSEVFFLQETVQNGDTHIVVKISYPKKQIEKNKIIIWCMPPNEDTFFPDSTINNKQLRLCHVLRNKLL